MLKLLEFPRTISYRAAGGPAFNTTINIGFSGFEQRNKNWLTSRGEWVVSLITPASFASSRQIFVDLLQAFFLNVDGMGDAFRLFDHLDHVGTLEPLGTGDGLTASFQLQKVYAMGARSYSRVISKPIMSTVNNYQGTALADTVLIFRNGISDAERFLVDATTGIVTFRTGVSLVHITAALQSGSNTTYTYTLTSGDPLAIGMGVQISGMDDAGNNTGSSNPTRFFITGLGTGTFTVSNPNGVTHASQSGFGTSDWIPPASVTLTASFQFHYPVRFDTDHLPLEVQESDTLEGKPIISVSSLTLKEVRILPGDSQG